VPTLVDRPIQIYSLGSLGDTSVALGLFEQIYYLNIPLKEYLLGIGTNAVSTWTGHEVCAKENKWVIHRYRVGVGEGMEIYQKESRCSGAHAPLLCRGSHFDGAGY
jgi:hypothetical protein